MKSKMAALAAALGLWAAQGRAGEEPITLEPLGKPIIVSEGAQSKPPEMLPSAEKPATLKPAVPMMSPSAATAAPPAPGSQPIVSTPPVGPPPNGGCEAGSCSGACTEGRFHFTLPRLSWRPACASNCGSSCAPACAAPPAASCAPTTPSAAPCKSCQHGGTFLEWLCYRPTLSCCCCDSDFCHRPTPPYAYFMCYPCHEGPGHPCGQPACATCATGCNSGAPCGSCAGGTIGRLHDRISNLWR